MPAMAFTRMWSDMSISVIPGVIRKLDAESVLYEIDWTNILQLGVGRGVPVVDRIASSAWAIDAASPAATVTLVSNDFEESTAHSWVIVSGGNDGDVIHLNNTITTTGAAVGGKNTGSQTLVRQIRIRVEAC